MEKQPSEKCCNSLPSASWNEKHLKLNTSSHPTLRELESEVGRFCFGAWNSPERGRLLVLAGNNGNGKTMMSNAVLKWVNHVGHIKKFMKEGEIRHLDCIHWAWPKLLDILKGGGWDVIDDMFDTCVLVIDDLGAGHDTSGIGTDKLCQLLSRREKKWTMITTNITPDAWQDKFDRRVASRLIRNSILVDLSDVPDYHG